MASSRPVWTVSLPLLLLPLLLLALLPPLEVLSQDFDLSDALDDNDNKPYLDFDDTPKVIATHHTPTNLHPKSHLRPPQAPRPPSNPNQFDLSDALDPNNDISGKDKNKGQGGGFSDSDLIDVSKDDTYKPDKVKVELQVENRPATSMMTAMETTAEVGTIAGIVSAVAMALVGAISSYISYQKKKLCFSLQQSLNTDMVKAENPEAVWLQNHEPNRLCWSRPTLSLP
ncbi:hypothetical protein INR49_007773 [Caranx melampygus]|nr:hypothetical protein INR49_007773 [Caranx melampygus]